MQDSNKTDLIGSKNKEAYDSEPIKIQWSEFAVDENFYKINKASLDAFLPRDQRTASAFLPSHNPTEKAIAKTIMRYAAINSKHIARKMVALEFTEKEGVNYASLSGTAISVSLSPLFDHRVPVTVRFNTVAAIINHELFHCRYTTPSLGEFLIAKGYTKKGLNKVGKEIQVADFSNTALREVLPTSLFKNILNILEDFRIEKMGLVEFPGYVFFFDDLRRYSAWRRANMTLKVSKDPLEIDKFLLDYLLYSVLMPERLLDFLDNLVVVDEKTNEKIKQIDTIVSRVLKTVSFQTVYDATTEIYALFSDEFKDHHVPEFDISSLEVNQEMLDVLNELMQETMQELGDENASLIDKEVKKVPINKKVPIPISKVSIEIAKPAMFDDQVFKEASSIARSISTNLAFLNSRLNRATEFFELQHGELDEEALYSLKLSNRDIFFDEEEMPGYSLDIAVLVDESGSMNGRKIQEAKVAALALALALRNNEHINLFVYGHTADLNREPFTMYRYLDPFKRATDFNSLFGIESRSCNADGYAIQQMGEIMKESKSAQKVLIVISDGQPAAQCYGHGFDGDSGIAHTREMVSSLERQGIFVIQIAVGNIQDSDKMFTHFIPYDGTKLGQNLKQILNKKLVQISNTV